MNDRTGIAGRVRDWLFSLPRAALVVGALAAAALFVTASLYAYRTYDYIQHDNEFCLSCHLMVDPFERFARSAHRELGCKACHQPTIITRSQMALTQIIENPDTLETHAEVPNIRCAECHVEGNPEEWTLVASSAGHRVHLESDDPDLEGLQCVQCHSSSLHEFAAADKTCGQAGCHTDIRVQLGKMGNLAIHCAACHAFSAPVSDTAGVVTAELALRPTQNECFSCHAMRTVVEMPADDPHDGVCSSCHNPHEQAMPAQAVESCATSGCHARPDTITPFHRGLAPGIMENCTACHEAHDFRAPGTDCIDCHKDIDESGTDPSPMRPGRMRVGMSLPGLRSSPSLATGNRGVRSPNVHPARSGPRLSASRPPATTPRSARSRAAPARAPQEPARARFRHANHRGVTCLECHSTDDTHGALRVVTLRSCQTCHHSPRFTQGPQGCARCHDPADIAANPIARSQTLRFRNGNRYTRSLPFDHALHGARACTECHTEPVTLAAQDLACTNCHTEHHDLDNNCTACHEKPPATAHNMRSHVSCDGAGCHREAPVDAAARSRNLCLSCHQDLADHRPGQTCVDCHPLLPPAARGASREDAVR